jgi:hypothetical protein
MHPPAFAAELLSGDLIEYKVVLVIRQWRCRSLSTNPHSAAACSTVLENIIVHHLLGNPLLEPLDLLHLGLENTLGRLVEDLALHTATLRSVGLHDRSR